MPADVEECGERVCTECRPRVGATAEHHVQLELELRHRPRRVEQRRRGRGGGGARGRGRCSEVVGVRAAQAVGRVLHEEGAHSQRQLWCQVLTHQVHLHHNHNHNVVSTSGHLTVNVCAL